MKILYRIELGSRGWFKYYSAKTGKYRGCWDAFKPNKKLDRYSETSWMPKDFRSEILTRIIRDRKKTGGSRRLELVSKSVVKAGVVCGWWPRVKKTERGDLIYWENRDHKGKIHAEFAFAILHSRWRKNPKMLKHLLGCKGYLRFVLDNGGKVIVWGIEKMRLR